MHIAIDMPINKILGTKCTGNQIVISPEDVGSKIAQSVAR